MPIDRSDAASVSPEVTRSIADYTALSAPRFSLRALTIPLILVVLAIGGGGLAQALNSAKPGLAAYAGTVIAVIGTIAAMALSYYVIYGLVGIKRQAISLLDEVAPLTPERADMSEIEREEIRSKLLVRHKIETDYGRGVIAARQALAGRVLNWAAIASN